VKGLTLTVDISCASVTVAEDAEHMSMDAGRQTDVVVRSLEVTFSLGHHVYNPIIWEVKAERLQVLGQPGLHRKPCFKKQTKTTTTTN
jgi:hypothetical protein